MSELDRLVWAGSTTVVAGDLHVGVRVSDEGFLARLRVALAPHLAPGVEAPPNYSVRVATDSGGAARPFHLVYRRHTIVVRTRDPRRLVTGLLGHLGSHHPDEAAGEVVVDALALVSEGGAALLPHWAWAWLAEIEGRLRRAGWQVVDRPLPTIDLVTGHLVVRDPPLDVDWSAFDGLDADLPPGRPEPVVGTGRWPLATWVAELPFPTDGDAGAAAGVLGAAGAVVRPGPAERGPVLEAVAALARRVPVVAVPVGELDGVFDTIGPFGKNLPGH